MHVAAVISQLVSAPLSVRIRNIPLRGRLNRKEHVLYVDPNRCNSTRIGICRGGSRGINQGWTARATVKIFVRRSRLGAGLSHLRAARIGPDARGCAVAAKSCSRNRESIAFAP